MSKEKKAKKDKKKKREKKFAMEKDVLFDLDRANPLANLVDRLEVAVEGLERIVRQTEQKEETEAIEETAAREDATAV